MYKIFQDLDQPINIKAYLKSGISHHRQSTILPVVTHIFVLFLHLNHFLWSLIYLSLNYCENNTRD